MNNFRRRVIERWLDWVGVLTLMFCDFREWAVFDYDVWLVFSLLNKYNLATRRVTTITIINNINNTIVPLRLGWALILKLIDTLECLIVFFFFRLLLLIEIVILFIVVLLIPVVVLTTTITEEVVLVTTVNRLLFPAW